MLKCAQDRLSQVMMESAATICSVPMKCDPTVVRNWYEDEVESILQEEATELMKNILPKIHLIKMLNDHTELCVEQLHRFVGRYIV